MRKMTALIVALLITLSLSAQKIETVYLNPQDSASNLYISIHPTGVALKGYLFLIPGMFQKATDVLVQTDLPKYAAEQGLLTIIPTFKTGIGSFGIDSSTQGSFIEILNDIRKKNKLSTEKFYVGGFSIGGTCALKYSELALANNYAVKPAAVFAIDSPLDFERLYYAALRETRLPNPEKFDQEELVYLIKRMEKEYGGSPSIVPANYHKLSPYSFSDTLQQSIRPLINLPIRLYTEPDVEWWLKEGADYSGMNAFDFAAITNELRRMGNTKIALITSNNKGFRKPGNTRHPHSWSLVESKELVNWLMSQ